MNRAADVTAADVIEKALLRVSIVKEIILNKHNDKNSVCYYNFFCYNILLTPRFFYCYIQIDVQNPVTTNTKQLKEPVQRCNVQTVQSSDNS